MKRLTSDKPVAEMGMFELAHNSCYIKDGKARYRDYSLDEDARVLTRMLLKDHADGDDAFTCDEDFDDWMIDYLEYGMDSIEGLIALFYRNLWAMADLREALKDYEDTGLSPEQIIEIDSLYAEKCQEVTELKGGIEEMKICPKCGRGFERLLALSRTDNKTMICDECGTMEALESLPQGVLSPQERTKIAVAATGNKWAMENFNATLS